MKRFSPFGRVLLLVTRGKSLDKNCDQDQKKCPGRYQNCVTLPSSGGSSKLRPPSFVILLGIDIHGRNETQQRQMVWWVRKYAFYLSLFRPTRHGRASPRPAQPARKKLLHAATNWILIVLFLLYLFFAAISTLEFISCLLLQRRAKHPLSSIHAMKSCWSITQKLAPFSLNNSSVIVKYDKHSQTISILDHTQQAPALSSSVNHIKNLINFFVPQVKRIWFIYYST